MHIALCSVHRNSAKQADAPRDTSEGKSHGSWDREVLSPSPPEVSSDTGGRRVEIGEQGTLTKLGQDPTRLGDNGGAFPDLR